MNATGRAQRPWCTGPLMLAAALGLTLASPQAAEARTHRHIRPGGLWGVGAGVGSVRASGSSAIAGAGLSMRAGYAFSTWVSFEMSLAGWLGSEGGRYATYGVFGPAMSLFPNDDGTVLRAGVGLTTQRVTSGDPTTTGGLGLMAGVGHEFRVTRDFAIGPQINVARARFPDGSRRNWVSLEVGMHWYQVRF